MLPFAPFSLETPDTWAMCHDLLVSPGALLVAGGTDLLPSMKHRLFRPEVLVSMRRLPDLRAVTELPDGGVALGAGLTLREVARITRDRWPALAAACRTVATPTIQETATLGGNVMLDTRCVYYNQPEGWRAGIGGCLKCDGAVCHVAPRGKGCYAAHSADTIPALWMYHARVELRYNGDTRNVSIADLYRDDGIAWHGVRRGEVVSRVILPPAGGAVVHRKLRTRQAIDYGLLLVAVGDGGTRAVISAVGPRPIEVHAPVGALAQAAFEAVQPLGTHLPPATWRKKMVRVEVERAARALA